ncbi:MAG TPA: hypothetical protein PK289_00840 [Bacteroidia bacterium]|jgi:hypothetical protein|nr:hypothetical protein [Bacteroidia bacterium]
MSADALVQYGQALYQNYEDWHPPIMAILLHYTLALGGGVQTFTLIQTLAGSFGVYLLAQEILLQKNVSDKKVIWYPFYIFLILILPVSPLPFYLMNFLKDTWIVIGMIWIAYLGLKTTRISTQKNKRYYFNYTVLVVLMALLFLTRYNAIVLLPVFFILLMYNSKRLAPPKQSIIPFIISGLLPFFIYFCLQKQFFAAFSVKKLYPENQVMATESVGALVLNIDNGQYVPYVKSNLTPNYKKIYYPGQVASVMNWAGSDKTLNQQTFNIADPRIKTEYFSLALHSPFTLAKVKLDGFYNMLKPSTKKYWYHTQLDDNAFGLRQNKLFAPVRLGWQRLANNIRNIMVTSLIGAEHLVWLIVNFILVALFIKRKELRSMLFIVLLMPLAYYFSYLLAITGDDFRFMYPATLLVQVITLSLLFSRTKSKSTSMITN